MKNFRIGMRLGLGFGVVLLIMIIVGLTGYWGVSQSTNATITMIKGDATVSEHASRARANVLGLRRYEKDIFLNIGDRSKEDEYYKLWQEQHEHLGARIADLEKTATLTKDKEKIATMKAEQANYEKGFSKVYAMVSAGNLKTPAEANAAIGDYKKEIHNMENTAKELADETNKRMDDQEKVMSDLARHIAMIVAISIIIGIILCFVISIVITRSITTPINSAVQVAQRLAEGDLTTVVTVSSRDEVGKLLDAMNTMVESLRAMIGKIRDTSSQVAGAAGEISASTAQLTRAAHGQASASDETSATMVQMAASIQTVAGSADSLASNADEVSSSIQELGASSEQVARSAEVMAAAVSETSATIEQMTVSIERVARNAEDLVSSVSETSSTIEQMTVSIDQVAGNSRELQQVVTESASTISSRGEYFFPVCHEQTDVAIDPGLREFFGMGHADPGSETARRQAERASAHGTTPALAQHPMCARAESTGNAKGPRRSSRRGPSLAVGVRLEPRAVRCAGAPSRARGRSSSCRSRRT